MEGATRQVKVNSRTFVVRELTVGEVRTWRNDLHALGDDIIGGMLFEDITIGELCLMCGMDAAMADSLTPSELRVLADAARELNPDFFSMRERLMKLVLAGRSSPSNASSPA